MKIVLLFLTLSFVYGPITSCRTPGGNDSKEYFPVTKVVDGDTFWIDDGTRKGQKIRLIGVDAPETRRTSGRDIGYYGVESKNFLTELLIGRAVRLAYDVDRTDRYGRTLAYVYLKDGTFVNATLLKRGYAMVMTVPPNVMYAEEFVDYQRQARRKKRGLWKRDR